MKKTLLFMALMLLIGAQTAAVAQELTVSDIEFIDEGYNEEEYPMIILTKEGSVLNVHLLHYLAHPDTEEFVITPNMSGGSDGEPYSVSIGVENIDDSETTVITTFGVSFNVHGIEANSFYLSCWWYKGMVSLTEGDPLELWENKNIDKDGVIYTLDNKTKTAALSVAGYVEGEYNIPEELDYEGETFLLTSIGFRAFSGNTSLSSVVIPKSVTNIGGGAFYRCSNLTDLYCHAENVPTTGVNVFTESSVATATLHVPAASVEKYKAASPWNEFGIIEALKPLVTFTKGQMATIVLPTVPDASKGKYYRLDRCEEGQIIFEQELQPQAHIPYIIVPNEDFSIDPSALDLAGLSNDTVSIGGISFIGSYDSETLKEPEGSYIDIIDTTPDCGFSTTAETGKKAYIGALRAYLQVSWDEPYNHGGSKAPGEKLEIKLKDKGTNIASPLGETGEGTIYDLSGRHISSKPAHGVYIKDGRKMIK